MWTDIRESHEPGDMSTDDLVTCYGLAGRLRRYEPAVSLDQSLGLWMFTARMELKARGELERVREWLPVYFDPTRREAMFGPGAELADPPVSSDKGTEAGRPPLRQIAG
jgi:hypothetical protein